MLPIYTSLDFTIYDLTPAEPMRSVWLISHNVRLKNNMIKITTIVRKVEKLKVGNYYAAFDGRRVRLQLLAIDLTYDKKFVFRQMLLNATEDKVTPFHPMSFTYKTISAQVSAKSF
jgi:hypothetical protein